MLKRFLGKLLEVNEINDEIPAFQYKMGIYDISNKKITTVTDTDNFYIMEEKGNIIMCLNQYTKKGLHNSIKLLDCKYADAKDRKDIKDMLNILIMDLKRSQENRAIGFIIPQNKLDLYIYIKTRHAI